MLHFHLVALISHIILQCVESWPTCWLYPLIKTKPFCMTRLIEIMANSQLFSCDTSKTTWNRLQRGKVDNFFLSPCVFFLPFPWFMTHVGSLSSLWWQQCTAKFSMVKWLSVIISISLSSLCLCSWNVKISLLKSSRIVCVGSEKSQQQQKSRQFSPSKVDSCSRCRAHEPNSTEPACCWTMELRIQIVWTRIECKQKPPQVVVLTKHTPPSQSDVTWKLGSKERQICCKAWKPPCEAETN